METAPSFPSRVVLAFLIFFKVLFDATLAARVNRAMLPAPEKEPAQIPPPETKKPAVTHQAASLHVFAMLQREGRFIDFVQEDIASFPDADVGAAARVVHEGCRKLLAQYVEVEPLAKENEGASITLQPGFDAARFRLTGNVVGNPPFKGQVKHRGWKASNVTIPPPPEGVDPSILAPAEVEL